MPSIRDGGGSPVEVQNPRPQAWVTPNQATINIVDTTASQTLTNKIITAPTISGATTSGILQKGTVTTYTGASDAINIALGDIFILNRSGAVNAATLADPAAGDEGRVIWIMNGTTQANTIGITSGLGGSGTSYDLLTFTNVAAANVTLRAYNQKWYLVGQYLTAVS